MIEQYLRETYQRILVDPIAKQIQQIMKPHHATILSGLTGISVLPALLGHQTTIAVLLLLISGFLDTLDGTLARLNHSSSNWGSVLDIMTDRIVEFTVIFALWSVAPIERGFWSLLMLGSILFCISSFLVVGIFSHNQSAKSFYYSPGLIERAEAFFFFIAMIIWPAGFNYLAASFCLLVCFTAMLRLYQFHSQLHTQVQ